MNDTAADEDAANEDTKNTDAENDDTAKDDTSKVAANSTSGDGSEKAYSSQSGADKRTDAQNSKTRLHIPPVILKTSLCVIFLTALTAIIVYIKRRRNILWEARLAKRVKKSLTKQKGEELMKEEDNILKKVGTENAFRVPEGYFENFTSELMNRLPEKEKLAFEQKEPTMWERVKPWAYMAAMFVGAALIIRVASSDRTPAATDRMAADETETEMEYINMAVDNSMLDDYSLYVYLADSDAE